MGGELIKGCIFLCVWVDGPINGAGGRGGGVTGLQGFRAYRAYRPNKLENKNRYFHSLYMIVPSVASEARTPDEKTCSNWVKPCHVLPPNC